MTITKGARLALVSMQQARCHLSESVLSVEKHICMPSSLSRHINSSHGRGPDAVQDENRLGQLIVVCQTAQHGK